MKAVTQDILQNGGEGIVVRRPNTLYQSGRTVDLLKFKAHRDQEAKIIEINGDECILQLPNDLNFVASIPENFPQKNLLQKDEVITFIYSGINPSTNLPKGAKIYRIRPDVSWKEVVENYELQIPQQRTPNSITSKAFTESKNEIESKEYGHWTMNENKNIRVFFDSIASSLNFDSLIAENWYPISRQTILKYKGGASIIQHYKGSYAKALEDVYPDIGIDSRRFAVMPRYYWHAAKNRKNFLNELAKSRGFDPLVAENWYSVSKESILNEKSGRSFLLYYRGSLYAALKSVYPRLVFDELMFERYNPHHWSSESNRRAFFDLFAKSNNFDPLIASNWHSVSRKDIFKAKSGASVLNYYGGSLVKALLHLYPNIGLEKRQFATTRNYWQDPNHRREFFNTLASQKGFDPLIAENWYSLSKDTVINAKYGGAVIYHHGDNFVKALLDLYPTIGLQAHKFSYMIKNYWNQAKNRRTFFDEFAKKNNFDSLVATNWYSISYSQIAAEKSGNSVLYHHNGSFVEALISLYPDIGLEKDKFISGSTLRSLWVTKEQRREYFVSFAAQQGFDPLIAENWYSFRKDTIGGDGLVANYYSGSFVRALVDLFPEVKFYVHKFDFAPRNYWNNEKNRKQFFDDLAASRGQDPLDPLQWYPIKKSVVMNEKNASKVLSFHGNSFVLALLDLYPEIGLKEENFQFSIREFKHNRAKKKQFLLDFAQKHAFDPLEANKWAKFTKEEFLLEKYGDAFMDLYGDINEAISELLFPELRENNL